MYSLKEIYYTIQGEGVHTGRAAVFCRFSGCNLWSGLEKDRSTAICKFCDTNFWGTDGVNGGKYSAGSLVQKIIDLWPSVDTLPFVVCTGGEPLLQLDAPLIAAMHEAGIFIAVETNGTLRLPDYLDWVCVSPKVGATLIVTTADELKLVYPQDDLRLEDYEEMDFDYYSLQPLDDADHQKHVRTCIEICKARPNWRLSLQTHKLVGIP